MRTLDQILNSIKLELQNSNSNLFKFNKYSNLYILFRTIAKAILEVESYVEEEADKKYIRSLTGVELDIKASEYGLTRNTNGIKASGYVLVSSSTSEAIPVNTVLTNRETGDQFLITKTILASPTEISVLIQAIEPKFIVMRAGTELYSSLFPAVNFIVANSRDSLTNTFLGDFLGGSFAESDEELRTRILARMGASYISTEQGLISSLLEDPEINLAFIKNNYPFTGYISVFIDNSDTVVKKRAEDILEQVIAAGVNYFVYPIRSNTISIYLTVKVDTGSNLNTIDSQVRNVISRYVSSISLGGTIRINSILGLLYSIPGITDVFLESPNTDIELQTEELANIENIYLTITT